MFRQLLVVCHGLIPTKDWEALLCYARWADMLWKDSYTGALPVFHVLCGYAPPCATEEDFVLLDEAAQDMVRAFKASSFEENIGEVSPGGVSSCTAYASHMRVIVAMRGLFGGRICFAYADGSAASRRASGGVSSELAYASHMRIVVVTLGFLRRSHMLRICGA